MQLNVKWEDNGTNNKSVLITAHYDEDERNALTQTNTWEKPCMDRMKVVRGLFRESAIIVNPTFRQFVAPGIRIPGLTDIYSQQLEGGFGFNRNFLLKCQRRMQSSIAPILEVYRSRAHQRVAQQRDDYFGVTPEAPKLTLPR